MSEQVREKDRGTDKDIKMKPKKMVKDRETKTKV